jgi:subtilisin family serine protease
MTVTLRHSKGISLTYAELDENFRDLRFDTDLDRILTNGNSSNKTITIGSLNATNDIKINNVSILDYITNTATNSNSGNNGNMKDLGDRVDIFAAGSYISSSFINTGSIYDSKPDPRNTSYYFGLISGTSMASPQIAGLCACIAAIFPNMKPAEMLKFLQDNSTKNVLPDYPDTLQTDNFTYYGLAGAPNMVAFLPELRPSKNNAFPMNKFKSRNDTGRVYPRPRIRRRG